MKRGQDLSAGKATQNIQSDYLDQRKKGCHRPYLRERAQKGGGGGGGGGGRGGHEREGHEGGGRVLSEAAVASLFEDASIRLGRNYLRRAGKMDHKGKFVMGYRASQKVGRKSQRGLYLTEGTLILFGKKTNRRNGPKKWQVGISRKKKGKHRAPSA